MSGIAAIYYQNARLVSPEQLGQALLALRHRGPDGTRIWYRGSVGLAHCMFHTTPESLQERLPLVNAAGETVITADARLDNRSKLIARLDLPLSAAECLADSALILYAYERWGCNCVQELLGDFAFVIWDSRNQILFCARDHFGVKPFYYYADRQLFVCASEIRGIFAAAEVPKRLNEFRIADYLLSNFDDATATFYQEILRLPPAHTITISPEGMRLERYWSLDASREVRLSTDEQYAETFRELFTEAVSCRLRSSFPIGSMLSGGLDSSSVTCVAEQLLYEDGRGPLQTFSAVLDNVPVADERGYIDMVTKRKGIMSHYMRGDLAKPVSSIQDFLECRDEPPYSFNLFINLALYQTASNHGCRIMLEGFDGDTTVSHGTQYLVDLLKADRWAPYIKELRAFADNQNLSFRQEFLGSLWSHRVAPFMNKLPLFPGKRRLRKTLGTLLAGSDRTRTVALPESRNLLDQTFVQRIRLSGYQERKEKQARSEREAHFHRLTWGVMPYVLEILDQAAAISSLEVRYPFWDKRLVEFCLGLPPEQKIRNGWTRLVLRKAMQGILPPEIQWRKDKSNLGHNFSHVFQTFEQELVERVLLQKSTAPYIDKDTLHELQTRFRSKQATDQDLISIWKAITLALWLQSTASNI